MAASIGAVTSSAASALQWGRRHGPRRRGDTPPRAPRTARASEAPPPSFEETEAILRRASEAPPPSFEETEAILRRASEARTEGGAPPGFERTMLWSDDQKKFVNAGEPQTRLDDPCLQGLTIEPGEVISRINKARGKGGRLDLTGIGLTKVPDEVWTLTDLTDLQLSNNKITRIPDDVGNLTELERLGLAGNRLTEIPEGIGGCECLEGLWAHGNLIGRVPDAVGRCERLRHLMLAGNRIRELPASLGDCKYLEELSVPGNRLESLPETIGGAYMLRVIDVHGNRIARLPDSIARLKSLEELSAQGNLLTSIPDDVGEMRRLVRLNVAENELSSLPKGLGDAAMMTTLWCYGNPALRSLPMSLAKNVSLKSVWCEGCDALEGDGVRELVEALPTRKGGVAATIGLDLAQCTRAGLKIRPATELDVNAAGGLACDHPHVAVSEIPGGGGRRRGRRKQPGSRRAERARKILPRILQARAVDRGRRRAGPHRRVRQRPGRPQLGRLAPKAEERCAGAGGRLRGGRRRGRRRRRGSRRRRLRRPLRRGRDQVVVPRRWNRRGYRVKRRGGALVARRDRRNRRAVRAGVELGGFDGRERRAPLRRRRRSRDGVLSAG